MEIGDGSKGLGKINCRDKEQLGQGVKGILSGKPFNDRSNVQTKANEGKLSDMHLSIDRLAVSYTHLTLPTIYSV